MAKIQEYIDLVTNLKKKRGITYKIDKPRTYFKLFYNIFSVLYGLLTTPYGVYIRIQFVF